MAEFETGDLVKIGVIFGCFAFFSMSLYTFLNVAMAASIVCLNIRHLSIKLLTSKKLSNKSHTICRPLFRAVTVSWGLSTTVLDFLKHMVLPALSAGQNPPQIGITIRRSWYQPSGYLRALILWDNTRMFFTMPCFASYCHCSWWNGFCAYCHPSTATLIPMSLTKHLSIIWQRHHLPFLFNFRLFMSTCTVPCSPDIIQIYK